MKRIAENLKAAAILAVVFLGASLASRASSDNVDAYEKQLQSISAALVHHDYYNNYLKDIRGQEANSRSCLSNSSCVRTDVKNALISIQEGKFEFISPLMVPSDAQELLSDILSLSSCKDLGFMNTDSILSQGPEPSKAVPYRPTEGFGIYKLPIFGHKILLVRGSEYNLAWPFWGADTFGIKLPPIPPKSNSLGGDFLTEIDAQNCHVIEQFNLERLNVFIYNGYIHESFSEPVRIEDQVYILQIFADSTSKYLPVYDLELVKLDMRTGRVSGLFHYSTFFDK
jgi:hypothetical protein